MNSIKKWIRDIFGFSGNEINGFLILIPMMLLVIFSEPIYSTFIAHQERTSERDKRNLDSLLSLWDSPPANTVKTLTYVDPVPLFAFDPNKAPVETLKKLGFTQSLASRIAAYRLKGGTFRSKADLLKIYGLDSSLYQQLYPYILLPEQKAVMAVKKGRPTDSREERNNLTEPSSFDINMADTVLLKGINGIGSKLAWRIIKFRDGLGGFVRPEQLMEVYGLDSIVVRQLQKISFIQQGFAPVKININTADEKQLSAHPYIRYKIARALITYRFQHGSFSDVGDIRKLPMLTPDEVEKILPYLKAVD